MKRRPALFVILAVLGVAACGPTGDDFWFDGTLEEAIAAASEQGLMVFVEFNTDWCSWCRRLEAETLTDRDVRAELDQMVAIQLDAEAEGASAASRFEIESYPTMVFLDSNGDEIERIVGYLPPDKLLAEVRRIRAGDTLAACLKQLAQDPTNAEAVRRVVEGLLDRSDPEGAIAKIRIFHSADGHDHDTCRRLMFLAGRDLHYRVYLKTAKLYRNDWPTAPDVPAVPGVARLHELLQEGAPDLDPAEQAVRIRQARFDDARELLDMAGTDAAAGEELFALAAFAFRGGHYELAADLYRRWFADGETTHPADMLNRAAWQLYLARRSIPLAVTMARQAYSLDPSADVTDTLARLLYVAGDHAEAVELEQQAADRAAPDRAAEYLAVAELMKARGQLTDTPAFESFPDR